MTGKKFTIEHGKIWQRPDQAYFDYKDAAKGVDPEKLEWGGKYKVLREKRDIAVFGACIYEMTGQPTFAQMNDKSASPDAFLLQSETDETTTNLAPVEITFYGRSKIGPPEESLVDRLAKEGGKFREKLPPDYWLLVHIGIGLTPNHLEVAHRLNEMNAQFGVFSIQEVSSHPDTILRFVVYNDPDCKTKDINLGEVFYNLSKSSIPGVVTQMKGFPPKAA